jgi:hypothetical protein
MAGYIKGEKPRDLDAAKGGLVLDRMRSFIKNPDPDMHPMGTGLNGPENAQSYAKGDVGDGDEVRKGDTKARSMGSLKKSKATAL